MPQLKVWMSWDHNGNFIGLSSLSVVVSNDSKAAYKCVSIFKVNSYLRGDIRGEKGMGCSGVDD
ncbi:hypothetical protein CM49_05847 [Paenibacillus sp. P1XP2]|nr:hypothetical protein CM49_05847 [Paenibacillus sp. P1XP2]